MMKLSKSAFEEIIILAYKGFHIEVTTLLDGKPAVIARKDGLVRLFPYDEVQE